MKKSFSVILLFLGLTLQMMGQKVFEGTLEFKMSLTGEGAETMSAFMPTGTTYKFKGSNILFKMEGGMTALMMGVILIKDGTTYMIKDPEKVVYVFKAEDEKPSPKPKVTKEDEVLTILDYKCQKYTVETTTNETSATVLVWATTEINIPKPKGQNGGAMGPGSLVEGVEGVALKKQTTMNIGGKVLMMEELVTVVKPEKLSAKLFKIPKGYEEKPGSEIMNSMGGN